MKVERHWWNGRSSPRERRDVYIRTDGEHWEVEARTGGEAGSSKVHSCPGRTSAEILADAWMGGRPEWREPVPGGASDQRLAATRPADAVTPPVP